MNTLLLFVASAFFKPFFMSVKPTSCAWLIWTLTLFYGMKWCMIVEFRRKPTEIFKLFYFCPLTDSRLRKASLDTQDKASIWKMKWKLISKHRCKNYGPMRRKHKSTGTSESAFPHLFGTRNCYWKKWPRQIHYHQRSAGQAIHQAGGLVLWTEEAARWVTLTRGGTTTCSQLPLSCRHPPVLFYLLFSFCCTNHVSALGFQKLALMWQRSGFCVQELEIEDFGMSRRGDLGNSWPKIKGKPLCSQLLIN